MVYRATFRTARATQRNSVSENTNKNEALGSAPSNWEVEARGSETAGSSPGRTAGQTGLCETLSQKINQENM